MYGDDEGNARTCIICVPRVRQVNIGVEKKRKEEKKRVTHRHKLGSFTRFIAAKFALKSRREDRIAGTNIVAYYRDIAGKAAGSLSI